MATAARSIVSRPPRRAECVTQPFELAPGPAPAVVDVAARTDAGLVRKANEDSVLVTPRLLAVADGMGGHRAGGVASRLAVETLRAVAEVDDPQTALPAAVRCANAAVHALAGTAPDLARMGTTLTAAALGDDGLTVAHVGDSRLYRLRGSELERLTRDHTPVEELARVSGGDERTLARPLASVLLRAIGARAQVDVHVASHRAAPGERWLLCSDGLTKHLHDAEIADLLGAADTARDAVDALVEATLARGASDNVTAVAFFFG
jgi:serine/threonine protein phosphatase PrpC